MADRDHPFDLEELDAALRQLPAEYAEAVPEAPIADMKPRHRELLLAGAIAGLSLTPTQPEFRIEDDRCGGGVVYGYITGSDDLELRCQNKNCSHPNITIS